MDEFQFVSYAQEVIFAPGSLGRLGKAAAAYGWKRILLCTSSSMRTQGLVARVENALEDRLVATFDHTKSHVPDTQVEEVLQLALDSQFEAVIGLGGGSPIGIAKAVGATLEARRLGHIPHPGSPSNSPGTPVIAIPTTYAGSEMTPTYGITRTHENPPRKTTTTDSRAVPRLVLYDPELTLDLPPELTASTGINALAHCIEALYSVTRHPLSSAAAISGVKAIHNSLLTCYNDPKNLAARIEMMQGAHLAGLSLASASMGLHHGICHVLGGTAQVPHGIANSVILPHAMRFNADATASLLGPAVAALGISADGLDPVTAVETAAQAVYDLVGQMGLPQRLRDVGIKETDILPLAQLAFQNRTVQKNPKLITDVSQLERLLREAW